MAMRGEEKLGRFAGRIGFLIRRLAGVRNWLDARREFWGKGYAIEGARRALDYAFKELDRLM